jgi:hypothetical protein
MSSRLPATLLCFVATLFIVSNAQAQQSVSYDHAKECPANSAATSAGCTPVRQLTAEQDEVITVNIANTCPDHFDYTVVKIEREEENQLQSGPTVKCDKEKKITIKHDDRYGGYLIHITPKSTIADTVLTAGKAVITIAVRTSEWRVGFGGGFTLHSITDPAFAVRETRAATDSVPARSEIIRQKDREDKLGRSVASFVHIHHSNWVSRTKGAPAITFGLGIDSDRTGDYYLGLSWLWGDRGALTGGLIVGQEKVLPAGRQLGDSVSDLNILANLGDRRTYGAFVGISFRFLGNGPTELKKPFAGEDAAPGTVGGGATTTPTTQSGANSGNSTTSNFSITSDKETIAVGETTKVTVAVKVKDMEVTWEAEGGVELSAATSKTNADGNAEVTVTGKSAGPASVTACVQTIPSICKQNDARAARKPLTVK